MRVALGPKKVNSALLGKKARSCADCEQVVDVVAFCALKLVTVAHRFPEDARRPDRHSVVSLAPVVVTKLHTERRSTTFRNAVEKASSDFADDRWYQVWRPHTTANGTIDQPVRAAGALVREARIA
jgi:hypothetical protein